jgi:peptidoglycan hydrolase-like protein with peptidoglycan-binding domain
MKEIKSRSLAICTVLLLSGALLVGCKPIFEKKPVEGKEGSKEAAPAAAPEPAPAPAAPASAPKAEELQSLDSLPSTTESLDTTIASPAQEAPAAAAPAQLADDGDDVVKTTPALMKKVQQALVNAGFNPGPVDGVSGGKTVAAIESFQKQQGIPPGKLTKRTLRALGVAH